jgi:hypothetical protein
LNVPQWHGLRCRRCDNRSSKNTKNVGGQVKFFVRAIQNGQERTFETPNGINIGHFDGAEMSNIIGRSPTFALLSRLSKEATVELPIIAPLRRGRTCRTSGTSRCPMRSRYASAP